MRILAIMFLAMLIAAFPFQGCQREQTLEPYRWLPAGGEFDSLTNKLEWQFNLFSPFDSILQSIDRMDSLAEADKEHYILKRSRALYWRSRYLSRIHERDSSLSIIKEALELNDSVKYRYDYLRMLSIVYIESDTTDGGSEFRHFSECLEYARKIDDKAFEAYAAINMGNLMGNIGECDKALYYFGVADSINNEIGYKALTVRNQINVARVLSESGDKRGGDSILKSLVGHPYVKIDTFVNNLLSRNIYASGGYDRDVEYLYRAYNEIKDNERFRYLRGLYHALLANYCYRRSRHDSMRYYAERAKADLPYVREYGHRAIVWFNIGLACSVAGDTDSALLCRVMYEEYVDSAMSKKREAEVLRLSAIHEMGAREAKYKADVFRRNMATAFIAVLLLAGGAVTALSLNRRNLKQKVKAMENELKLEKAQRKMAATAISMEEKDKVLDALKTGLSELREEGEIKAGDVRQLESAIKSHMLEHDTDEAFQQMFDVVNPGFKARLKVRCPNLADSYVKMACYILMELDNKKIAKLMMIKPESVHQARWRLRQRLGLKEGETLESALEAINKSHS